MATKLSWTLTGTARVEKLFHDLKKSGGDLLTPMRLIGATLAETIRGYFAASRDPYGGAWERLRSRKGQPLIDTGRLRNSITYNADSTKVTIGTNVEYGRYHQLGARLRARVQTLLHKKKKSGAIRFVSKEQAGKARTGYIGVTRANIGPGKIPARPFLPQQGRAMPSDWSETIARLLAQNFSEVGK